MAVTRLGKYRVLYLLALLQLVGGPLVLLQVTVFCKVALHEAPQVGMATAAINDWHSDDFQAVLAATDPTGGGERKSTPPSRDPGLEKAKLPVIPWQMSRWILTGISSHCKIADRARTWTPAWPQAPPGPPPRIG